MDVLEPLVTKKNGFGILQPFLQVTSSRLQASVDGVARLHFADPMGFYFPIVSGLGEVNFIYSNYPR